MGKWGNSPEQIWAWRDNDKRYKIDKNSLTLESGEKITTFYDCTGIPEDGMESLVYLKYEYWGLYFDFRTKNREHRIKYFHNGEGIVEY